MSTDRFALLVEDAGVWQEILGTELLRCGFAVDWTADPRSALDKLRQNSFPYTLVVLDANLDTRSGVQPALDIASEIVRRDPAPSIVLVSGLYDPADLARHFAPFKSSVVATFQKGTLDRDALRKTLLAIANVATISEALFRPDYAVLRSKWSAVSRATTANERGKALEVFAEELLSSMTLMTCVLRRHRTATAEIDLVFSVENAQGTVFEGWGSMLLVECKNWSSVVGAPSISQFAVKLHNADCRVGILFARSGVSGRDRRDALGAIANTFLSQRRAIIVLSEADVFPLVEGRTNLYDLLADRFRAVRLMT